MGILLTQPKGSVAKEITKQTIALLGNTQSTNIEYIKIGLTIDTYNILFEKSTQTIWNSTSALGVVQSWSINSSGMILITSTGTYTLQQVTTTSSLTLSSSTGANGIGFLSTTVSKSLTNMLSLGDIGVSRPILGYDSTNDKLILDRQLALVDNDLMHVGSIAIGKKFRGVRRNAINLSLMGSNTETSASDFFNSQIVGVSNSTALANYGMTEGVNLFMFAKLQAPESWENVTTATYTSTTAVLDTTTYSAVFQNLKRGDCIRTNHSTTCWGMVDSWNASTGTITVTSWATTAGTLTPANGTGFVINYISKAYCMNAVGSIAADALGSNMALAEFDGINNKSGASLNGLDLVMLSQTTYDGTAAFLARTASSTNTWVYGFRGASNRMNFYSTSSSYSNYVSTGTVPTGLRFAGTGHTFTLMCNSSSDMTDLSQTNITMALHTNGAVIKLPIRYQTVTANISLSSSYGGSLINASTNITITLPASANYIAGSRYEMYFIKSGSYTINGNDTTVNGFTSYSLTVSDNYKKYSLLFDGTNWYIFS